MTALCIPIFIHDATDWQTDIRAAEAALGHHPALLEFRCDRASPAQMLAAIAAAKLPVLITIRPIWEGGLSEKSFEDRAAMFAQAAEAGATYIDLELVSWQQSETLRRMVEGRRAAGLAGPHLIISSHDFTGRPDLEARLDALAAIEPAAILKLAFKASTIVDAIDALALTELARTKYRKPLLALAMGEFGQISRLLGPKFRQPFTFASLAPGSESAPGQATVRDMLDLYRFPDQTPASPVFGVIGWPVGHSLSPHIHNAGFRQLNFPGIYVPLPIEPTYDQFAAVVDALHNCPHMNLRGLSVTIPHKENALRYVKERGGTIDELSQHIGVINTLLWKTSPTPGEEPQLRGLNSDYAGALDALVSAWSGTRDDLAHKRIAILGAGGAARAIVAGLAAYGANVTIYNRTLAKAQALAADFHGRTGTVLAAPWNTLPNSTAEIYINCTPLGMHPNIHASPLDFDPPPPAWSEDTIVFDTVYNPLMTQFLQTAQRKHARIVTGLEMFTRQAAIQFEQFTGKLAPTDLFRQIMTARLIPIH